MKVSFFAPKNMKIQREARKRKNVPNSGAGFGAIFDAKLRKMPKMASGWLWLGPTPNFPFLLVLEGL